MGRGSLMGWSGALIGLILSSPALAGSDFVGGCSAVDGVVFCGDGGNFRAVGVHSGGWVEFSAADAVELLDHVDVSVSRCVADRVGFNCDGWEFRRSAGGYEIRLIDLLTLAAG